MIRNFNLIFIVMLLIVCSPVNGCHAQKKPTEPRTEFLGKLGKVAALFTADKPTLQTLSQILEAAIVEHSENRYAVLTGKAFKSVITLSRNQGDSLTKEIMIYPASSLGITLKDIEMVFGKWQTIHRSKTSSVRFAYAHPGSPAVSIIYVSLAFPPDNPDSPVRMIKIHPKD